MKLLSVAIFKLCFAAHGLNNQEAILTCFDKYVNCSINIETMKHLEPEKKAIEALSKCEGGK